MTSESFKKLFKGLKPTDGEREMIDVVCNIDNVKKEEDLIDEAILGNNSARVLINNKFSTSYIDSIMTLHHMMNSSEGLSKVSNHFAEWKKGVLPKMDDNFITPEDYKKLFEELELTRDARELLKDLVNRCISDEFKEEDNMNKETSDKCTATVAVAGYGKAISFNDIMGLPEINVIDEIGKSFVDDILEHEYLSLVEADCYEHKFVKFLKREWNREKLYLKRKKLGRRM